MNAAKWGIVSSILFTFVLVYILNVRFLNKFYSVTYFESKDNSQSDNRVDYKTLWNLYMDSKNRQFFDLSQLRKNGSVNKTEIDHINARYFSKQFSLEKLMEKSEPQRKKELKKLSDLIDGIIYKLQHPLDCDSRRRLVCLPPMMCGFGCYTHFMAKCLLKALESNRVMISHPTNFGYAEEGWTYAFQSISSCQFHGDVTALERILTSSYDENLVRMVPNFMTPWIHWTIPSAFFNILPPIHGDPSAWFIGQAESYITRPRMWLAEKYKEKSREINFKNPIVGIHIRRTDKKSEADYHEIGEYMFYVKKWFKYHRGSENSTKSVYVATDSLRVLMSLKARYPSYEFKHATDPPAEFDKDERFTKEGLEMVLLDIHFLSRCDYVVCTLTSNVCKMVYELMMNKHVDPSTRIQSLDVPYRFRVATDAPWRTVEQYIPQPNSSTSEIELRRGDKISVDVDSRFDYKSGYLRGTNKRTGKTGLFPAFIAHPYVHSYNYSIFENASSLL